MTTLCRTIEAAQASCTSKVDLVANVSNQLKEARNIPEFKNHSGIKDILTNFLIAISGIGLLILAATASKRGSFWYHSDTDTVKKLSNFEREISDLEAADFQP